MENNTTDGSFDETGEGKSCKTLTTLRDTFECTSVLLLDDFNDSDIFSRFFFFFVIILLIRR